MILTRSENPDGTRVFNRCMTLTDSVDSRQRRGRHPHRLDSVMDNCALPDQTHFAAASENISANSERLRRWGRA